MKVIVMPEAERNVDVIYTWLAERSPAGASRWFRAYLEALRKLEVRASRYPLAHETVRLGEELRQSFFRTPKGRRYRLVFRIVHNEVHVLHVRGFGQNDIT